MSLHDRRNGKTSVSNLKKIPEGFAKVFEVTAFIMKTEVQETDNNTARPLKSANIPTAIEIDDLYIEQ